MDKLYYLLECNRLLLGHPQLKNLQLDIAGALAELEKQSAAKRADAAPKAVPNVGPVNSGEPNAPVGDVPPVERRV